MSCPALQVQDELAARAEEADSVARSAGAGAREAADLARQRFVQTHPDTTGWSPTCWSRSGTRSFGLWTMHSTNSSAAAPNRARGWTNSNAGGLASNFPRLWNDPGTPHRERKRMARLLVEDVTLIKATRTLGLGVRLRGGATR